MVNNLTEAQINEIVARVVSEYKKPSAPSAERYSAPAFGPSGGASGCGTGGTAMSVRPP